jgi:hypothetical protein
MEYNEIIRKEAKRIRTKDQKAKNMVNKVIGMRIFI